MHNASPWLKIAAVCLVAGDVAFFGLFWPVRVGKFQIQECTALYLALPASLLAIGMLIFRPRQATRLWVPVIVLVCMGLLCWKLGYGQSSQVKAFALAASAIVSLTIVFGRFPHVVLPVFMVLTVSLPLFFHFDIGDEEDWGGQWTILFASLACMAILDGFVRSHRGIYASASIETPKAVTDLESACLSDQPSARGKGTLIPILDYARPPTRRLWNHVGLALCLFSVACVFVSQYVPLQFGSYQSPTTYGIAVYVPDVAGIPMSIVAGATLAVWLGSAIWAYRVGTGQAISQRTARRRHMLACSVLPVVPLVAPLRIFDGPYEGMLSIGWLWLAAALAMIPSVFLVGTVRPIPAIPAHQAVEVL